MSSRTPTDRGDELAADPQRTGKASVAPLVGIAGAQLADQSIPLGPGLGRTLFGLGRLSLQLPRPGQFRV